MSNTATHGRFSPIGIEIGRKRIRMIQWRRRGDRWTVHAAASKPSTQLADPSGLSQEDGDLSGGLQEVYRQAGFRGRSCVAAMPSGLLQFKTVRLPHMPPEEMAQAAAWEGRQRLEGPTDDLCIQHFNAGQVRQGEEKHDEIIVMGTPQPAVLTLLKGLAAAGLDPLAVDAEPAAMGRVTAWSDDGDRAASVLVADIGSQTTRVTIARPSQVKFFKFLTIGFEQLTTGQGAGSDNPTDAESRLDDAAAADLVREIGLCLRYFSVTFRGEVLKGVRIAGGGAYHGALLDYLNEHLEPAVEPASPAPWLDLAGAESVIDQSGGKSAWLGAMGVALWGCAMPKTSRPRREAA